MKYTEGAVGIFGSGNPMSGTLLRKACYEKAAFKSIVRFQFWAYLNQFNYFVGSLFNLLKQLSSSFVRISDKNNHGDPVWSDRIMDVLEVAHRLVCVRLILGWRTKIWSRKQTHVKGSAVRTVDRRGLVGSDKHSSAVMAPVDVSMHRHAPITEFSRSQCATRHSRRLSPTLHCGLFIFRDRDEKCSKRDNGGESTKQFTHAGRLNQPGQNPFGETSLDVSSISLIPPAPYPVAKRNVSASIEVDQQ